jgi:hypothetical protein
MRSGGNRWTTALPKPCSLTEGPGRATSCPQGQSTRSEGIAEAFYLDVAVAYLEAIDADPQRPIGHLAAKYPGHSEGNVRDWVAKAREKGYLTSPGMRPTWRRINPAAPTAAGSPASRSLMWRASG